MNTEQIKNAVEKYHNYIVEMRREFHRYPEVSGKEQHTREILVRELEKMGVPYRLLPGTGLIGIMEGGKPGKHRVVPGQILMLFQLQRQRKSEAGKSLHF